MCKKSMRIAASALLPMAVFPLSVSAFQPLITDDTGTQGSGGNQVEMSVGHDRAKAEGATQRVWNIPFVYSRGASDSLDLFAGFGHARIRQDSSSSAASGNLNPILGAKWRFYENETTGSTLAIKPEVIVPVSRERESSGFGTGRLSGNLTLVLSQEVPFGAIHLNVGAGGERYRDARANPNATIRRVSVAPVWDVGARWKLAADVGRALSRAAGVTTRSRFVELGALYSPGKDVDLAFGFIRNTDNASPKSVTNSLTAGVTWRFM